MSDVFAQRRRRQEQQQQQQQQQQVVPSSSAARPPLTPASSREQEKQELLPSSPWEPQTAGGEAVFSPTYPLGHRPSCTTASSPPLEAAVAVDSLTSAFPHDHGGDGGGGGASPAAAEGKEEKAGGVGDVENQAAIHGPRSPPDAAPNTEAAEEGALPVVGSGSGSGSGKVGKGSD